MIIKGKRAVAYFDVLGFKSKIENTPIEDLAKGYENTIRLTDGRFFVDDRNIINEQICYRYVFSDSIFLIAKEDTEESFVDLLSYAWRMMQMFIACGFPLRGAVAYGDIYANLDSKIFLGKAISEAVILEGQQDWIGALVDNSAIDRYSKVFEKNDNQSVIMKMLFPVYSVPLKGGLHSDYHVINWRQNLIAQKGIKPLFKNEPYNESVQVKIDNALCFSKKIVDSGTAYFQDDVIPVRYRRFYVASGPPPSQGYMPQPGDEY